MQSAPEIGPVNQFEDHFVANSWSKPKTKMQNDCLTDSRFRVATPCNKLDLSKGALEAGTGGDLEWSPLPPEGVKGGEGGAGINEEFASGVLCTGWLQVPPV